MEFQLGMGRPDMVSHPHRHSKGQIRWAAFPDTKTLCHSDQIGFAEVAPGRIGHLRIHFQKRAFDVIGCYQHTDAHNPQKREFRNVFWQTLEQHLTTIPNRNTALIVGDFNCSLLQQSPYVGTSSYMCDQQKRKGPQHTDMHSLMNILRRFHLTALNSWNGHNPPTFVNSPHTSSIDHMFLRIADADSVAKDVKLFPAAEFLPLRGAMHIPMTCSIRKIPYEHTARKQTFGCSFQQRLHCRAAWIQQTTTWTEFHTSFAQGY